MNFQLDSLLNGGPVVVLKVWGDVISGERVGGTDGKLSFKSIVVSSRLVESKKFQQLRRRRGSDDQCF